MRKVTGAKSIERLLRWLADLHGLGLFYVESEGSVGSYDREGSLWGEGIVVQGERTLNLTQFLGVYGYK